MRRREDRKTIKALFESEAHWEDVVARFDPKIGDKNKWFEANCKGDNCAICNLDFLCDECPLYDRGSACFEAWRDAWKAAKKGSLRRDHLETVLTHIRQTCDLYRDKIRT